jgi:hypothetical protein
MRKWKKNGGGLCKSAHDGLRKMVLRRVELVDHARELIRVGKVFTAVACRRNPREVSSEYEARLLQCGHMRRAVRMNRCANS